MVEGIRKFTPSRMSILYSFLREVLLQGGIYGFIITTLTYKYYISMLHLLKDLLGNYSTEHILFTIMISISHTILFYTMTTMFTIFDKLSLFQQYKMPRTDVQSNESKQLYWKTFIEVSVYQFFVNPILAYLLYPCFVYFGSPTLFAELPTTYEIIKSFCIAHFCNDFFFYWTHRALHAFFYNIHKQHHSHHGPISICAEYANPVESLFSNVFPSIFGIMFFPSHPLIGIVWLSLRVRQTLETHSGFCFNHPVLEAIGLTHAHGSAHHDFHHSVNQPGNFGEGEYMDYVFGTLNKYVDSGGMTAYIERNNKQKES